VKTVCLAVVFVSFLLFAQDLPAQAIGRIQSALPTDADEYVIGPEDILYIHVWREENLTRTIPVRMDGRISIPLIDDVQAAGLTPLQLKDLLTQKLKAFIEDPTLSVVVTEPNSCKVYVSGGIRTPGVYRLRSRTSLLQLIPMAGGFTEWANQKKILISGLRVVSILEAASKSLRLSGKAVPVQRIKEPTTQQTKFDGKGFLPTNGWRYS
jgi:protein involved in polysaccharide export with SLBB domain